MNYNLICHRYRFYLIILASLVFFFGCTIEKPVEPANVKLTDLISDVSIDENYGEFISSNMPLSNSNSVPIISGTHEIVNGGSLILSVQPSDPAKQLIIGLRRTGPDYLSLNFGEIDPGYFLVDLENNSLSARSDQLSKKSSNILKKSSKSNNLSYLQVNSQLVAGKKTYFLVLSFKDKEKMNNFSVDIASVNGAAISKYATHAASVNSQAASSNNLQVSLNWIDLVDIDLHVETPDGNDIYYDNRVGQNNGNLDLDSNPACEYDYVNNENITWLNNKPAKGLYTVKVDLWSACQINSTLPFVVTVKLNGKTETFTGSFSSSEETHGEAHSGRIITHFTIDDVSVLLSDLTRVPVYNTANPLKKEIKVILSPSPLQNNDKIELRLTSSGTGSATFSNGSDVIPVTESGNIEIRGKTNSSVKDDITITAYNNGTPVTSDKFTVRTWPTNFRQIDVFDHPSPDPQAGVLIFNYLWDSESGNIKDLKGIIFRELVDYPGAGPKYTFACPPGGPYSWYLPGFGYQIEDPTIISYTIGDNFPSGLPFWDGIGDTHWIPTTDKNTKVADYDKAFMKTVLVGYVKNEFSAQQNYQFIDRILMNDFTNMPGKDSGPIVITKSVFMNVNNKWIYQVTKNGSSSTRELPN